VHTADVDRYDSLPENDTGGFYTIVRNVTVVTGTGIPPFVGDVGIVANRRVRLENGERRVVLMQTVEDIGDLRTSGGLFEVDGSGKVLAPLVPGAAVGEAVTLPEGAMDSTVGTGVPANLMLLSPLPDGRHRVERVWTTSEVVGDDLRGRFLEQQ
jgi:hypothetical protein